MGDLDVSTNMSFGAARRIVAATVLVTSVASCTNDGGTSVAAAPTSSTATATASVGTTVTSPTETVDPNAPRARAYALMTDAPGDSVLLYGGQYGVPPGIGPSDVWSFSPRKGWNLLDPGPEDVHGGDAFEYVASSDVVVVVNGNETWTIDPRTGTPHALKTEDHPRHVWGTRFAYDTQSDRVVAFGGLDPPTLYNDTWALDVNGKTWTKMHPQVSPPPENFIAMAYEPLTDRVIMFNALGQTWAYDYDEDTWTDVSPKRSPKPRTYSAMVYDPVGERIVMFGGVTEGDEEPFGDTWAYDPRANEWTGLDPKRAPSPRGWHSMAFDAETGMIYLFSGGETRDTDLADLWRFNPKNDVWTRVEA